MPKKRDKEQEPITIVPTDEEVTVPEGLIPAVDHLKAFVEDVLYEHPQEDSNIVTPPDEPPPSENE